MFCWCMNMNDLAYVAFFAELLVNVGAETYALKYPGAWHSLKNETQS